MFAYIYGNPGQTNVELMSDDKLLLQEIAMDDYFNFIYEHWYIDSFWDKNTAWIDPKMYWDCYKNLSKLYRIVDISDKII